MKGKERPNCFFIKVRDMNEHNVSTIPKKADSVALTNSERRNLAAQLLLLYNIVIGGSAPVEYL